MNALVTWMLYSLVIGGVVVLAALAAHDAQRAANRSVRWVWCGAIALIVALSFSAPLRRSTSSQRVSLPAAMKVDAATDTVPTQRRSMTDVWSMVQSAVSAPLSVVLQATQRTLSRVPLPVQRGVAVFWSLASLATLFAFTLSYLRVRRQMRDWPIQKLGEVNARIAPSAGPAVVGLVPSEIILPSWLMDCPPEEQALVITHEHEHVRAGDPWLLVLACAAVACMPWHPALWFALGRLRLAVELDCDRRVLRRGIPAAAYGSLLIDLSALHPALPSAMPAFSCNGSYLERRLVAMTSRPTRFATGRRLVGGLIATVALITACESKLPTSAEIDRMDAGSAERALVAGAKAEYEVNGYVVTEDIAKKIEAARIASVSVSNARPGVKRISIVTDQGMFRDTLTQLERAKVELSAVSAERATGMRVRTRQPDTAMVTILDRKATEMKRSKFDGLLLLDGKVVDNEMLNTISPDRIEKIDVVKGAAAQAYNDPRAVNGVIKITLKH